MSDRQPRLELSSASEEGDCRSEFANQSPSPEKVLNLQAFPGHRPPLPRVFYFRAPACLFIVRTDGDPLCHSIPPMLIVRLTNKEPGWSPEKNKCQILPASGEIAFRLPTLLFSRQCVSCFSLCTVRHCESQSN